MVSIRATWPARECSVMHSALQKVCTSLFMMSTINPNFFCVFLSGSTLFYPGAPLQVER